MTLEQNAYKNNLEQFSKKVGNKTVDKLLLSLDANPDFDIIQIPFHFEYANLIEFRNDALIGTLRTSMTSNGFETFSTLNHSEKSIKSYKEIIIGEKLMSMNFESISGFDYPYKLTLTFIDKKLFIYCGDIYKNDNSGLEYKVYDEMLLFFDQEIDAMNFERHIKLC